MGKKESRGLLVEVKDSYFKDWAFKVFNASVGSIG